MPCTWPSTRTTPWSARTYTTRAGQAEREDRAEDDDQGQQHAAVDQQQDHQHGAERDAEQQPVDSGEGVGQVGLAWRRARPTLGRGPRHRRPPSADPVDGVADAAAEVGAELYDALQGPAVVARRSAGEGRPATPSVPPSEARAPVAACCWASVTRPRRRRSRRRSRVAVPLRLERLPFGDDLRRLGAARQEGRLVVGGDLAELARVRAEGAPDAQPGDQQHHGKQPSDGAWQGCHRSLPWDAEPGISP